MVRVGSAWQSPTNMAPCTIAIMQPTYLSWIGYFDLIDQSDCFVILDSVQFSKRSWQQRNRVKAASGAVWCTVAVHTKGHREQPINAVEIDHSQGSLAKHARIVSRGYEQAACNSYLQGFFGILQHEPKLLADLNGELIQWMCDCFGIETRIIKSSDLVAGGAREELLVNICKELGASRYLSAAGSRGYIEERNPFPAAGVDLVYHDYQHPVYSQLHGEFESHLSALDLLLNEGTESLGVIRSGRVSPGSASLLADRS